MDSHTSKPPNSPTEVAVFFSPPSSSEQDVPFSPREGDPNYLMGSSLTNRNSSDSATTTGKPSEPRTGSATDCGAFVESTMRARELGKSPIGPGVTSDEPLEKSWSATVPILSPEGETPQRRSKRCCRRSFTKVVGIPFVILIVAVAAAISITTGVPTTQVLHTTRLDVHGSSLETLHSLISTKAAVMLYAAQILDAMYRRRLTNFENVYTLSAACRLLDQLDPSIDLRSLTAVSLSKGEYAGCMHGDPTAPNLRDLFAAGTVDHMANGSWVVDPTNYHIKIPLQQWERVVPSLENATDYVAKFKDKDEYFADGAKYKENPNDLDLAQRVLWHYPSARPLMLTLTYPLNVYDTQAAVDTGIPEGRAVLRVHMDASTMLRDATNLGNGTTRVVLVTSNLYDGTNNPQVASINWNQSISNDTSEWLTSVGGDVQNSSRLSDLNDPIVKNALQHLSILDVIDAEAPEGRTVRFFHRGAPCIATLSRTISPQGLDHVILIVSAFPGSMGPALSTVILISFAIPITVILVILMFFFSLRAWFTIPLRRMTTALLRSASRFSLHRVKVAQPKHALVRIAEMVALEKVYDQAMSQLRKVDGFLPPSALTLLLDDNDAAMEDFLSSASDCKTTGLPDAARGDAPMSSGGKNTIVVQSTSVCSGVTIFPALRSRERHRITTLTDHLTYATLNMPIALTETSPMHNAGPYLPIPENRGTSVYPFESEEQVSLYFDSLAALAKHFNGEFSVISPDATVLYFVAAVKRLSNDNFTEEAVRRAAEEDALSAVLFSLNLQRWYDTFMKGLPKMVCAVDTSTYTIILRHLDNVDTNIFTLFGRLYYETLGCRLAELGSRVLMTEQTANLVQAHVRQLPIQPLTVSSRSLPSFNIVLYEALEGDANDPQWCLFSGLFSKAFTAMVNSNYSAAARIFHGLRASHATRPEWCLTYQLFLQRLHNSATQSRAIAVPPKLRQQETHFCRSYQLDRLGSISSVMRDTGSQNAFVWFPTKPLYHYSGLDPPMSLSSTLQVISTPSLNTSRTAEPTSPTGRQRRRTRKRASLLRRAENDPLLSRAFGRRSFKAKSRGADDPALVRAMSETLAHAPSARFMNASGSQGANSSSSSIQNWIAASPSRTSACFRDNFGLTWILPQESLENLASLEHFRIRLLDANALGSNGSLAMVACFKATPQAGRHLATHRFEDLFPQLPYSRYIEPTVGYHLSFDPQGQPECLFAISDYCSTGQLRAVQQRYGRMPPLPALIKAFADVARGLVELHRAGFVHGYVQPEHILICVDGHAKIRAYFAGERAGHLLTEPPNTCYAAPEVIDGAVPTTLSDSFNMGLVLAEILLGVVPWTWSPEAAASHSPGELASVLAEGGPPFYAYVRRGEIVLSLQAASTATGLMMGVDNASVMDAPVGVLMARRVSFYPAESTSALMPVLCGKALALAEACLKSNPEERLSMSDVVAQSDELLALCRQSVSPAPRSPTL